MCSVTARHLFKTKSCFGGLLILLLIDFLGQLGRFGIVEPASTNLFCLAAVGISRSFVVIIRACLPKTGILFGQIVVPSSARFGVVKDIAAVLFRRVAGSARVSVGAFSKECRIVRVRAG